MSKIEYNAALYLRLSKEDGDKEESDSIANQRALGLHFIRKNSDIKLYKEFVDDGYTGSNFDRPDFQDMIDLILKGKINCVIVKDLSRFAREYIDAGYYLEKLFPAMGVRFISINDNVDYKVDSSNNTKLIVAFKNILNDSYIRDTSIKIRSHLEVKRQSGEYIGAFVVMGYQKAKDDKHKLEIDKDAAVFIKHIFSLYFMGISASAISNKLNLCGVPSPAEYKKQCGSNYKANAQKRHTARWSAKAVIRILSNPIYMGTLIQGKHTTVNYKVKKVIVKDESEWAVKYDNHEAIIPQDYFERIQHLLKQDTRVCPGNEEPYLFSGFLKCGDCGDSLIRRNNRQNGKEYVYYMCSQNKLKMGCTSHRVSETVLYTSVFTAVNTYCKNVADLSKRLNAVPFDKIKAVKLARIDKASYDKKMEIKDLQRTIALVERRFIDKKESKETFEEVCADIKLSIDSLEKEIAQLAVEKENIQSEVQRNMAWIQVFTENGEIKELNRLLLANLVKEIVVYEDKRIVVRFNYQDKYMQLLSLVEQLNNKEDGVNGKKKQTTAEIDRYTA